MAGRPSLYSEELAERILDRLAEGESLTAICRDDDMPHRSTVLRWEDSHPDFATRCARGREWQGDAHRDKMDDVRDKVEAGLMPPDVARVILANLEWTASKLNRRYGNKITNEHTGENGGPIKTQDVTLTPTEAKAISQALDGDC